ncbi:MAG: glycosyltransferase [Bryobacteraceae bacterium]
MAQSPISPPKVSVVMLTYNRPQKIGRAITSVCAQTFDDWELIIVENGNNPETHRLLAEWLAKEPRIRHFHREAVGSIALESNFGIEQARGEYIAILDDDDYWGLADKLARQVEFLDRHPDYAGCGGGYIMIDQDDRVQGKFFKPETDAAIRAWALLANPMANSTAMFRRIVNGQLSLYDPALRQFADWDFWLTMGARGKLYNFIAYLQYYTLWESGSSFMYQKANARASLRILRKHRREYRCYWLGLALAYLYFLYACLPAFIRRFSYRTLSAAKKTLASVRGSTHQP